MSDVVYLISIIGGVLLLGALFFILIRSYVLSKKGMFYQKINLEPELKKLDKTEFKIVKKLRLSENDKIGIDYALVSNYGVFLIKKKDILGIIEKAPGREGYVVKHKENTRFYKDESAQYLASAAEKVRQLSPALYGVEIYTMTVYPDKSEVRLESGDFCGNLKDAAGFIKDRRLPQNEISEEVKNEIYEAVLKEKSKYTD